MTKRLSESERARRASLRRAQKETKTRAYSTTFLKHNKPQTRLRNPKTGRFVSSAKKRNVKGYWKLVNEVKQHPQTGKTKAQKLRYSRGYIKWYVKQENKKRRKYGGKTINWRFLSKQVAYNKKHGIDKLPEIES